MKKGEDVDYPCRIYPFHYGVVLISARSYGFCSYIPILPLCSSSKSDRSSVSSDNSSIYIYRYMKLFKTLFFAIIAAITLSSCNNNTDGTKYLPSISGNAGDVLVIINKAQWEGELDKNGTYKGSFTMNDYILAGFPVSAAVYKTKEDMEKQIKWEQNHLDSADVIAMVLLDDSKSPISLLEMGLYAKSKKLIVFCTPEFYRYDNVR